MSYVRSIYALCLGEYFPLDILSKERKMFAIFSGFFVINQLKVILFISFIYLITTQLFRHVVL